MNRFNVVISVTVVLLTAVTGGVVYYQTVNSTKDNPLVVVESTSKVKKDNVSNNPKVFDLIGNSIETFPDTGLINQNTDRFRFEKLPARPTLLSFIFTRCPNVKMCPLITQKMARVQRKTKRSQSTAAQFVSITIDPGYDRPSVLKKYAGKRNLDFSNWDLVTGDTKTIKRLEDRFNVSVLRQNGNVMNHNMRTYLIDSKRIIRHVFTGSDWSVETVTQKLRGLSQ